MSVNSTQGLLAVLHRVHGKAVLAQDLGDELADQNLVFDH
jgi:hypothetical protein